MGSGEKVVPKWHPNDYRPRAVAFAAANSNTEIPYTNTERGKRLEEWLRIQARWLRAEYPQAADHLNDLSEMYMDAFEDTFELVCGIDEDAFNLHCCLCAFTHAVQFNTRPV